jgi:hypothetical protein
MASELHGEVTGERDSTMMVFALSVASCCSISAKPGRWSMQSAPLTALSLILSHEGETCSLGERLDGGSISKP